ncbi:MAG: HAD family phosphatase [Chloroflexota bacterium]
MTTNIKTIIFDFGGVLVDWDPRNLYRRYFPNDPQAMERFLSEVNFLEWNSHQDRGRPFAQAVAELSGRFPQYGHLILAFHQHWEESLVGDIPESVAILKALKKKGYALYGLSNWSAETFPKTRAKYPFFELFDDIVLSGEVRLIKPDPAIFKLLIQRTGERPEECLLIDDSEKNIAVAKELGFQTIHFTSGPQVRAELQRLNILP